MTTWTEDLLQGLRELQEQAALKEGDILIIGTSTSEVRGEHIGKAGTLDTAAHLWEGFTAFQQETGVRLAFQGCEHINRAVLVERETAEAYHLEPVNVVPIASAGGSMAEHAYKQMQDPVVVEEIRAHAGIDIGDTFIGMHLKKVAVPVRTSVKQIGEAHVTYARTRPKLIGGARAQYQ
ncbi:TIGR01440 family protein [Alkalicoccus chagannorensis]|uniref:TIGR01440 family protein n=1 Tax=Alkalicoccus chagannorensis TaxID=427072 RepID=UPI0004065DE1|nr:TIGR01440 family protein [Alkalicoccus chagannorensis]